MNLSSRWRHHLSNFHRKKKMIHVTKTNDNKRSPMNSSRFPYNGRTLLCSVEFLVSNILRSLATHVKANTRPERVCRQSRHDRRHHTWLTGGQGRRPDMAECNYRDHIQDKTRLRDKNCCLRYLSCKMGKKKKYQMYHVIVLLWFQGFH